MKLRASFMMGSALVFILGAVVCGISGCEKATGLAGLTLNPATATLTPDQEVLTISVVGSATNDSLALPIEWSVADSTLGYVSHSGGYTAVYRRHDGNGVNTVMARDQYDNEGVCTIQQTDSTYALALSASPDTTIEIGEAVTISVETTEAQAPFSWRERSGPGQLTSNSGSTAVYSSSTAGVGIIQVTDANGVQGEIAIVIQDSSTGGDTGGSGGPGGA